MKERIQFNYAQRWKAEQSGRKRMNTKKQKDFLLGGLCGLLAAALLASPWIWQEILHYRLAKIEQSIAVYHEVAATLNEVDGLQAQISGMNSFRQTAGTQSKKPRDVLTKIEKLLPAGATVNTFSLQADNSVQIGLEVKGPTDLAKLWMNFRDSGLFTDFDMKSVSLTDEVQHLSLTLKLK
jgi:hypothetical protein